LETVIAYLKQRIKECVKEASKQNSNVKEKLKKEIQDRLKGALVQKNNIVLTFRILKLKIKLFRIKKTLLII
jgi:hypothetical protein